MLVSNPTYQENFSQVALGDNVECVTLALKATVWDNLNETMFLADFAKYCMSRCIDYCFFREMGRQGNVHYHGIMGFQYGKSRKNFTSWFNRYWGRVFISPKGDTEAWYRYCSKDHPEIRPPSPDHVVHAGLYLFDASEGGKSAEGT